MKASLFDLDHTLLVNNCSYRFGAYLYKQKVFSFYTMLKLVSFYTLHKANLLSMTSLHQKIFQLVFKGKSYTSVAQYIDPFLSQEWKTYAPAIERLQFAKQNNHFIAILSSSPDFLVKAIASKLNIKNWKATIYQLDNQANFCEISNVLEGKDKAAYIDHLKKDIAIQNIIAYSDSHLDIPFLKAAGTAIGVNPNKKLRRLCQELNWEVI